MPTLATLPRPSLLALVLTAPLTAQWSTIAQDPINQVTAGAFVLTHQNAQGIHAFSAMSKTWTTVSPPGSSYRGTGDYYIVTLESGNVLRGYSARRNASATQTVSSNTSTMTSYGDLFVVVDTPPASPRFLRAYSAVTNAWSSITLNTFPASSPTVSRDAVVQFDGTRYVGFSVRTGQWAVLPVTTEGRSPQANDSFITVDLAGNSALGPRQIAAFSGIRGCWTVSPIYPSTGAGVTGTNHCAIARVELPNPAQVAFAGYSASTAQWVTSTLVHNTAGSITTVAWHNVARVLDSDVAARYELFGAGHGRWYQLTGAGLSEAALHEDFTFVANAAGGVLACSGMVAGGFVALPSASNWLFPVSASSKHVGLVNDQNGAGAMWGYSAATNAFTGPVPLSTQGQSAVVGGGAVAGFNVYGYAGYGTNAQALSARWGNWVAGPAMVTNNTFTTLGAGSVLVDYETFTASGYALHVFDEHRNAWRSPFALPPNYSFTVGENAVVAWTNPGGTIYAYSAQRGDWTSIPSVPPITSAGGGVNLTENLAWWTAGNQVYAFGTPDTTHSWYQWPLGPDFATSGPGPAGSAVPFLAVSVKGTPGGELAFLYASLTLAPSPITVPGIGSLDLDPNGAVFAANLGTIDSDGLAEVQLPLPPAVPGLQLWYQTLKVDLNTVQPLLPGRATGAWIF
jgi:hypothetical protein